VLLFAYEVAKNNRNATTSTLATTTTTTGLYLMVIQYLTLCIRTLSLFDFFAYFLCERQTDTVALLLLARKRLSCFIVNVISGK